MRNLESKNRRTSDAGNLEASSHSPPRDTKRRLGKLFFPATEATTAQVDVLCLRDGLTKEEFLKQAIEAFALMRPGSAT